MADEVELTIVLMIFDASEPEQLLGILSKYTVMSRMHAGCRVIDLSASQTTSGRFVIVQKWESPAAQQRHFDSPAMIEMAQACPGLLTCAPRIELLEGISAHDLK